MADHLIGITSLITDIPGLVEVCLHLGGLFVQRLEKRRNADEEISDTALKPSTYWNRQKSGLAKLKITKLTGLDENVHDQLMQILEQAQRGFWPRGCVVRDW